MHDDTLNRLHHSHQFVNLNKKGERRTKLVVLLTFSTMLLEIVAGTIFGSIALLADGWHMGTHVAAFMITLFAYRYARRHAQDDKFAFGAGKVGILGAFASSVALGVIALLMLVESAERLWMPRDIRFDEAILVAGFGLLINIICAFLLKGHIHIHDHNHHDGAAAHHHTHDHHDDDEENHYQHDHNLKAAYLHILADMMTSILAIIALCAGKYYGWTQLDPAMGIIGSLIISHWAYGLLQETSPLLLDESINVHYKAAIQEVIEADADNRIADLHIWQVGPGQFAVILSIVTHEPKEPNYYKDLLQQFNLHTGRHRLAHITVEIHKCTDELCEAILGDDPDGHLEMLSLPI